MLVCDGVCVCVCVCVCEYVCSPLTIVTWSSCHDWVTRRSSSPNVTVTAVEWDTNIGYCWELERVHTIIVHHKQLYIDEERKSE